jgi:PKD repeat protein
MNDKYEYYLIYEEDGRHSHYYVERMDTNRDGEIDLTYFTNTHTLDVEVYNIKKLSIYSNEVYYDEATKVFKMDPYSPQILTELYYDYFIEERDEFTVTVYSDERIEELRFKDAPEPVEVFVDGDEWWKTNTNYEFESGDIVLTEVPKGSTQVVIFFKERLRPHAIFSIGEENTVQEEELVIGFVKKEITFDASDSHDDDDGGIIDRYKWDFGDGSTSIKEIPTHEYRKSGSYTVNLTVFDNHGLKDYSEKIIKIVKDENDLDEDGMDDSWEALYDGLDPTIDDGSDDADDDGLTNKEEFDHGSNPNMNDTDGDEYPDYDEVHTYLTLPNDPESKPPDQKVSDKKEADNTLMIMGVVAIIIIVVILILLFLLIQKRKQKPEAEVPPPAQPPMEGAQMGVPGEMPPPPPMMPPPEQPEQPQPPYGAPPPGTEMPQYPVRGPPGGEPDLQPPPDLSAMESEEYEPLDLGMEQAPEGGVPEPAPQPDISEPGPGLEPPPSMFEGELGEEPFAMPEEGVSPDDLALEMEGMKMPVDEGLPGEEGAVPPPPGEQEQEPPAEPEEPEATEEPGPEEETPEMKVKDHVKNGALFFKDGKYSDAIIEWQKALDIEPDHPEIVESIQEAMNKLKEQNS